LSSAKSSSGAAKKITTSPSGKSGGKKSK
jgi:hypothetical protein